MRSLRYAAWMPLLLILVFGGCDQVLDIINPDGPPAPEPVDLTVTPNGGAYTPPGLTENEQARLITQQGLTAGDGTAYLQTLKSLDRLLAQLGEDRPPSGVLAAPPRLALQGRLAPERALELSRVAPVTLMGPIDAIVEGISFSGYAELDDMGLVHAELEAQSADGTQLSIAQTYSQEPEDLTYQLSVAGTLVYRDVSLTYDLATDYDEDGNGMAEILIEDGNSLLAYHAKVLVQAGVDTEGAEAVTRPDGFWIVSAFQVQLESPGEGIQQGIFSLNASNGFEGEFLLTPEGTGSGAIANASGQSIAQISVSPQGDLVVLYADGSGQAIIQL